jgi:hypothetical protein
LSLVSATMSTFSCGHKETGEPCVHAVMGDLLRSEPIRVRVVECEGPGRGDVRVGLQASVVGTQLSASGLVIEASSKCRLRAPISDRICACARSRPEGRVHHGQGRLTTADRRKIVGGVGRLASLASVSGASLRLPAMARDVEKSKWLKSASSVVSSPETGGNGNTSETGHSCNTRSRAQRNTRPQREIPGR